ncbi:MAG: bifunctional riboflavin kinase/FMN adenylyltransferase, partial [Geminicoccaceae bacterium]|nr:bifunctional riboflavin kinase/FMN adenylyltransferase [Geminicoccaceae bacterium]
AGGYGFAALTFEPHPREVLDPARAPGRLSPFRRKAELLAEAGVEHLFVLPFTPALMSMPAEAFVDEVLLAGLGARALACGVDFRFGHRRRGDTAMLRRHAERAGAALDVLEALEVEGAVCSSTRIRGLLAGGEVKAAAALLGGEHQIIGIVRPGDRRGRQLGFPTANTWPLHPRAVLPASGVYAVRAGLIDGSGDGEGAGSCRRALTRPVRWLAAAASVGTNPTFAGTEMRLEVHLLDGGPHDLYGRRLRVAFVERLRDEERFDDADALVRQMRIDCERARAACGAIAGLASRSS